MRISTAAWQRVMGFVVSLAYLVPTAWGADHRDGPRIANNTTTLGNIDINDVYVFKGPGDSTVLIMTVSPAAGLIGPATFRPGATYEFLIDHNGDLAGDVVFQVGFSEPNAQLRQSFQVTRMGPGSFDRVVSKGVTSIGSDKSVRIARLAGGGHAAAGLFDDPFFFDLLAFNKFVMLANSSAPLAQRVAPFLPPSIPNDFFGNFNVLAIALEVPAAQLRLSRSQSKITVWARTMADLGDGQGVTQFDRMGLPAINTAVIQPLMATIFPTLNEDNYNLMTPSTDAQLRPIASARIQAAYGVTATYADTVAATVLPDVIPFDTLSSAGFLNGRRLTDDVIDAEFSLLTNGALTSDRVVADDVFRSHFPYLAPPLGRNAALKAMAALEDWDSSDQSDAVRPVSALEMPDAPFDPRSGSRGRVVAPRRGAGAGRPAAAAGAGRPAAAAGPDRDAPAHKRGREADR